MFTFQSSRKHHNEYDPVSGSDSHLTSMEDAEGLLSGEKLLRRVEREITCRNSIFYKFSLVLGAICFLALYSYLLISYMRSSLEQERLHGAGVIDTPAREALHYEAKFMGVHDATNNYTYLAEPSPELDQAWEEDILRYQYSEVPAEYMARLGRLDEGVRLENGNYIATLSVFHQLHCLKRLHHSFYIDHYFPNMTKKEKWLEKDHYMHCLYMIMETLKCQADVTPLTMMWAKHQKIPTGNFHIQHECVNWDRVIGWAKDHVIDPFAPGVLVHPTFGPVFPQGKNTPITDRVGVAVDEPLAHPSHDHGI